MKEEKIYSIELEKDGKPISLSEYLNTATLEEVREFKRSYWKLKKR